MEENENLITVTGKGSVHVLPDVTRVYLSLVSVHDNYEEAYAQAKANTEALSKIMNEVKLDTKLPKTVRLDINKKTESKYDKYHNFIGEKFIGYLKSATLLKSQSVAAQTAKNAIFLVWTDFLPCVG